MSDNRTTELVSRREATTLLEEFLCGYQNILLSRGINASEAVCRQNELINEYAERIEQAIAATLGGGKLTADDVLNAVYKHGARWQAIADELNATLGSGTCIALPMDAAGEPIHVGDVLESTNAFKNWCVVVGIGDATKHDHIIYVKFEAAGDISQTSASKFIHRKPDAERGERKAVKR